MLCRAEMTCASVYSNLVLFLAALAISTLCGPRSAVSCLPVRDTDILAGADFLSILMDNSFVEETTARVDGYVRSSRSTPQQDARPDDVTTRRATEELQHQDLVKSDDVATRWATKEPQHQDLVKSDDVATKELQHQDLLKSDDVATKELQHQDLVAESSKSELSVEEGEPITKDVTTAKDPGEEYRGYAARVRPLPLPTSSYDPSVGFRGEKYPRTYIYHDGDSARSRSVSYSSIVRDAAAPTQIETEKSAQHERQERNYDAASGGYNVNHVVDGGVKNDSRPSSKDLRSVATTERNWETQERPYVPPLQKIYGRPEQNYEVDEVVSVVTNGRAHGVQPSLPPPSRTTLPADNQKVGYVVEGRNYRKYRVEERTADGFIVGEYGVVSHDDGSLRGVRYTADGTINPRLISEALMKFLSL